MLSVHPQAHLEMCTGSGRSLPEDPVFSCFVETHSWSSPVRAEQ